MISFLFFVSAVGQLEKYSDENIKCRVETLCRNLETEMYFNKGIYYIFLLEKIPYDKDLISLQKLLLEPSAPVFKDLGNRSAGNDDDIQTNLDVTFRFSNSHLGRFSISVLSCYVYIFWFICYANSK